MRSLRAVVLAVALPAALPAQRPPRLAVELVDTVVVTAPQLDELSGIEASRRPGVYWLNNDSGDRPMLYAVDSVGTLLGAYRVHGAVNRDWEALAAGPCFVAAGRCLYIGDIGNNNRRRERVVIYRLHEPEPGGPDSVVQLLDSIVLSWGGSPHDAEGLAVAPDGRVLVTAKDLRGQAMLYAGVGDAAAARLEPLCALAMRIEPFTGRLITGLAVSPDGTVLVVRTYVSLHFFRLDRGCTALTDRAGIVIPVVESQGEAVAFESDDRLVLVSERGAEDHAIITRLRVTGLR